MEIKILASVIGSREHWDAVSPHITKDELTPEGALIWKILREYYDRDQSAPRADMDIITQRVLRHVEHNAKHREALGVYLQKISLVDVSGTNVVAEVLEQKRNLVGLSLADALTAKDQATINRLIEELLALNLATDLDIGVEEEYVNLDVNEIIDAFKPDNLIKVAPRSLNYHLGGGALRGHHLLLAAMPEVGKSLFALQMAAGFVMQNLKVLYIGNEDPIKALIFRFINNLTGMTKYDIIKDPEAARQCAMERNYSLAVFAGLAPGTLPEIRSLILKHKPDVLIVDQLRNIQVKSENRTGQLEAVARGMRDFARQHNLLAVSVTQAGDSARGRRMLNMGDIDGSNIGIPGACDVMIMVGMTDDDYKVDQRHITLAKNKLTGDHGHWVVNINKGTSRIVDQDEYLRKLQAIETIEPTEDLLVANK